MKKQNDKPNFPPSRIGTVPYLPGLLGKQTSEQERAISNYLERGFGDEETAMTVGCRSRKVRHFRERLGIPDLRQRAVCRSMPFSILQSFGFLGNTCFVTILLRRLHGLKIEGLAEEPLSRQSFSPASEATQSLASLEGLFRESIDGPETDYTQLRTEVEKSIQVHSVVRELLHDPAAKAADYYQQRPVSVVLVAGQYAGKVTRLLKMRRFKTDLSVIRLKSIREIVGLLDSSVLSLYSSRLWLGIQNMLSVAQTGSRNGPTSLLNCSLGPAEILRLLDSTHSILGATSSAKAGIAFQPPDIHLRRFARNDEFLIQGRRDRNPVLYTPKPWARKRGIGKQTVSYALPYDLPKSAELYSSPEWIAEQPTGIRSAEREGDNYLVAREDGLLGAIARTVRSRSFALALKKSLHLGAPGLAAWCGSFATTRAKLKPRRSETDTKLTAIYALMNFDIDFLMRHFDRDGQSLILKIESRWQYLIGKSLAEFSWRLKGSSAQATRSALLNFCKIHARPVRYMLLTSRQRAELICHQHVRRCRGTLAHRLESLGSSTRSGSREERALIESTLESVDLYTGFAVSENALRDYFVRYASIRDRGERAGSISPQTDADGYPIWDDNPIEEADKERGKMFVLGQQWDPENPYDA